MFPIVLFVRATFFFRRISANRRDVDHPCTEFDKGSAPISHKMCEAVPFDWDFQISDIVQTEVNQLLVFFLTQMMNKCLRQREIK